MTDQPSEPSPPPAEDAAPGGATIAPDRESPGGQGPAGAGHTAKAEGSPEDADPDRPRLTRGAADRKVLAGVCHGAGRHFDVDPVIFRVVLVVLSLTGGIGLIVYGMGWLVIPQEGEEQSEAHRLLSGRIEGAPLTAVLMALVGCGLYASMLGNGANQAFSLILLTATAGAVYWSQQRRRMEAAGEAPSVTASAVVDAPPAAQPPPAPGGSPSWWRGPLTKEPSYLWGPDDGPYGEADKQAWRERKKAVRRERSWGFPLVLFLLAVTAASAGTWASWAYQPVGVSLEIGLAAALAVFGTGFVISSFAGRARGGTAVMSVLTVAALIGAATLPRTGHGVGSTTWQPTTTASVRQSYEVGTGIGTLDLTRLPLNGATVTIRMKVGAGQAVVRLPENATTHLHYSLRLGEVVLPGKVNHGVRIQSDQRARLTLAPPPGTTSTGTIDLRVTVGVGQLKVIR
ncbi:MULTISPECIES: PspC domain-containing protein [unclassified Streptomyces]|uniref:PspC domain-containing protein n=1 Tax=unclassified Streptomyces TaxID=2593676 RepID=UPI002E2DA0F4|nr:PspC domain-containing protein [Streptomyces sp. NBC_00223]